MWRLSLLLAMIFALARCSTDKVGAPQQDQQILSKDAHLRMVDTLDYLARVANPVDFYHLNTKRATLFGQQLSANTDPKRQAQLSYAYASELVSSGQLDLAIATLVQLTSQVPLQANTKPFYDLLAVAHLRKGEVQNCLNNHNDQSCIMPIQGSGLHLDKSGSAEAIRLYEKILGKFPEDDQTKYLFNVAHQTLGSRPPEKFLIPGLFGDVGKRQFIDRAGHGGLGVNRLSGGVALGDFNGDGYTDIFATSYGFEDDAKLFTSQAAGGFSAAAAHLEGIRGGLNCQAADYDNDGDLDVLVLRGGWFGAAGAHPNSLLQNDGSGRFTDVTFDAGLGDGRPSQTAVWTDVDLDGDLDLFVGNEASDELPSPCELFVNNGDGTFNEQAKIAGVDVVAVVKGVTAGDVNGDGWPDLYVSCLGQPNVLLLNQGSGSSGLTFRDATNSAGVGEPNYSFPTWMFDYDQDGDLDIFVSGYDARTQTDVAGIEARVRLGKRFQEAPLKLYQNDGSARFTDVTRRVGLDRPAYTMGSNTGDLTNDGYPDMYLGTGAPDLRSVVPNLYFVNSGEEGSEPSFRENTFSSGLGHIQKGHGVGFADFDFDGDLDIYTVLGGAFEGDNFPNALFENQLTKQGAWLSLTLSGKQANRSAIGARIKVLAKADGPTGSGAADGKSIVRYHTVGTGGSFGGNDLTAHIGLANAMVIESVEITWPSKENQVQSLTGLETNTRYIIQQGESQKKLELSSRRLVRGHEIHAHQ